MAVVLQVLAGLLGFAAVCVFLFVAVFEALRWARFRRAKRLTRRRGRRAGRGTWGEAGGRAGAQVLHTWVPRVCNGAKK